VAFHPELVMWNGIGVGVVQVSVSQKQHARVSELAEKTKDTLDFWIVDCALELDGRPVA
jgi:hypothetical protein